MPLVSIELIMIILDPYLFRGFYQYDPDMGFRVRPHTNGTNKFGFNDKDYPLEKPLGTFRILILSDSFNWAGGREGNYTALLENKFNADSTQPQVEVINAGYPMTHTGEQFIALKKYGLQYNPDLVVLGFFAGNDFIDADPERKRIVVNDIYIDIDKGKELKILGYPIIAQSRLLLFLQQKYKVFQEMQRVNSEAKTAGKGTFSEATFLSIEKARMEFCNESLHERGVFRENIDLIFQSIAEMSDILKASDIDFMVAIYPDEFQVNEELTNKIFTTYQLDRNQYDLDLMQKLLKDFLSSKDIHHIDMLSEFRVAEKTQDLYLLRDTHWNAAGNQLAANILFENLRNTVEK